MATGPDLSSAAAAADAPPAKKDRHIVTWSPEEDGLLRAQIALHGTDNWTAIAAQFKDKTSRQCRRRWYNYLNSECKKGGWSQEEDMLLCEAQKLLGNKWTEIAKVVSGRTDNAVKNRFSTLCKKRAKDDDLFKENSAPCTSSSPPIKQMRSCASNLKESALSNERSFGQEWNGQQHLRQPLAVISPNNQDCANRMGTQSHGAKNISKPLFVGKQSCVKDEGNFLKRDDPKFATLLQQADLLCSLAKKVNAEHSSQSMDEAWKELQDHLVKTEEKDMSESSMSGIASLLEDLDDLIVDPYSSKEENEQKLGEHIGQIDMHNEHSNGASETSMEVTSQMPSVDQNMENCAVDDNMRDSDRHKDVLSTRMESCADTPAYETLNEVSESSRPQDLEFSSPAHMVPTFEPFAVGMPSPKFTASERNFLLSVVELTSPDSRPDSSQQPSCKRALLESLQHSFPSKPHF